MIKVTNIPSYLKGEEEVVLREVEGRKKKKKTETRIKGQQNAPGTHQACSLLSSVS